MESGNCAQTAVEIANSTVIVPAAVFTDGSTLAHVMAHVMMAKQLRARDLVGARFHHRLHRNAPRRGYNNIDVTVIACASLSWLTAVRMLMIVKVLGSLVSYVS